jgi:hypothetical protein
MSSATVMLTDKPMPTKVTVGPLLRQQRDQLTQTGTAQTGQATIPVSDAATWRKGLYNAARYAGLSIHVVEEDTTADDGMVTLRWSVSLRTLGGDA